MRTKTLFKKVNVKKAQTRIDSTQKELQGHEGSFAWLGSKESLKKGVLNMKFRTSDLMHDKETILFAVEKCGAQDVLTHASEELRSDMDFMIQAIKLDVNSFAYASQTLLDNPAFIKIAKLEMRRQNKLKKAAADIQVS